MSDPVDPVAVIVALFREWWQRHIVSGDPDEESNVREINEGRPRRPLKK